MLYIETISHLQSTAKTISEMSTEYQMDVVQVYLRITMMSPHNIKLKSIILLCTAHT